MVIAKKQNKQKNKKSIKSKFITTGVIMVLCIGVIFWAKSAQRSGAIMKGSASSRVIGNPKADILVVEHLDFQCPPCAKGYFMLKEYVGQYPERVRVELKYFPWLRQPHALQSAIYSECSAQQNKFWEFTDALLKAQSLWKREADAELMFREIARNSGMDETALAACVMDEVAQKTIMTDREEGEALGIRQTPTYYINGKMVVGPDSLKLELNRRLYPEK